MSQKTLGETLDEKHFLSLENKEVAEIVKRFRTPKVVVLVPDNTRRTGIIFWRMKPEAADFESELFERLSKPYMKIIKSIFSHGIRTLFIPGLTHGNLSRGKKYVEGNLNHATRLIFQGEDWLNFYNENGIKVKIYGNLELIQKLGYPYVLDWREEIEKRTSKNKDHTLFWGYACSSSLETARLMDECIDFYKKTGRYPTREEKIKLYYGEHVDDVDIFIRPGEIRDSDCQPPLIGGKAQMYFPLNPITELRNDFFRRILYDFLYCRMKTFSKKKYVNNDAENGVALLKRYYERNKDVIIGLGQRVGKFWIPNFKIKLIGGQENELI
jgi:hypothetical protein